MSKKFEYNFTNQNELIDLRQRVNELQDQNNLLKQSLEELIRVNTQLTESIEEFNNDTNQQEQLAQQVEDMSNTIDMLNSQIQRLRREGEYTNGDRSKSKRNQTSGMDQRETQSLVGVLEELIESFKNMQTRYENQIQQFQNGLTDYKNNYDAVLAKLQDEYKRKLSTMEPVMHQLGRKDDNIANIDQRLEQLQRRKDDRRPMNRPSVNVKQSDEYRRLQDMLEQKSRRIEIYQTVLQKLKMKFIQKL